MNKKDTISSSEIHETGFRLPPGPAVCIVTGVPRYGIAQIETEHGETIEARMNVDIASRPDNEIVGQEALVYFDNSSHRIPVLVTLLAGEEEPVFTQLLSGGTDAKRQEEHISKRIEGDTVVIEANKKLELRVGTASIEIDDQGKITVKGSNLLNRSTGPIRLKGGHVDIN